MSDLVQHVTDAEFDNVVLKADGPVLIDFWAEWCGPCKMLSPVLERVAAGYQDKLTIVKMNIDENAATPGRYGVRGIPTLLLFKNGDVAATKVGALTEPQLKAFIDSNI